MKEETFAMYVSYKNVVAPLREDPESAESRSIMELIEQRVVSKFAETAISFDVDYPVDQSDAVSFCEIYDDCYNDVQVIKIHVQCQL